MRMKRWKVALCSLFAAALLIAPLGGTAGQTISAAPAAEVVKQTQDLQLVVDNKAVKLSSALHKENGTILAPAEDLFGSLGIAVVVEKKTQTIIARDGNVTLTMTVGKKEAVLNGKNIAAGTAAISKNGVVYVPVRFAAEQFGAKVQWDGSLNAVVVSSRAYLEALEEEKWLSSLPQHNDKAKLSMTEIVDRFDESVVLISTNYGSGSGVVIDKDLILTNYHVMEEAVSGTAISIYYDEYEIMGLVIYDEDADLAIIRTKTALDLEPVNLTYNYSSRKGERVVAIGSPLGFQNTVSEGVVSGLHFENGVSYIQTSVPIDHGSSGGALINEYGELIGITSSGIVNTQAHLNFAVSAYQAAWMFDELTPAMKAKPKFLTPSLPDTLVGKPLTTIQKLLKDEFGVIRSSYGEVELSKWEVKRDGEGWLVMTANIDPVIYMYYSEALSPEMRYWAINLGHELHRMLPDEKIQVQLFFERDYSFQPRGLAAGDVTPLGDGKWRVRYAVLDMQLKDRSYVTLRK